MADNDRLTRLMEIPSLGISTGVDPGSRLTKYQNFENITGTFPDYFEKDVYYWNANQITDVLDYSNGTPTQEMTDNTNAGDKISNYDLGTSSPITPLRYQLIPEKYWEDYVHIKLVAMYDFETYYVFPQNCSYKIIGYIGTNWLNGGHYNFLSGNPGGGPTLANIYQYWNPASSDSCQFYRNVFGSFYQRHTVNNPMYGTHTKTGVSEYTNTQSIFKCNYAKNGIKILWQDATYQNCDGFTISTRTNYNGPRYGKYLVPGNRNDNWYIFGFVITSIKLSSMSKAQFDSLFNPSNAYNTLWESYNVAYGSNQASRFYYNAYLELEHTSTQTSLWYVGDDTSNQSTLLNSTSGSQDQQDNLRYVYYFYNQNVNGFPDHDEECLQLRGIENVFWPFLIRLCLNLTNSTGTTVRFQCKGNYEFYDTNDNLVHSQSFVHSETLDLYGQRYVYYYYVCPPTIGPIAYNNVNRNMKYARLNNVYYDLLRVSSSSITNGYVSVSSQNSIKNFTHNAYPMNFYASMTILCQASSNGGYSCSIM